ncbi:MAG: hypothetical protein V7637_6200 [Mycobacteriales bacterium]|jgi:hypothetical protein
MSRLGGSTRRAGRVRPRLVAAAGVAAVLAGLVAPSAANSSPGQTVADLSTVTATDLVTRIVGSGIAVSNVRYVGDPTAAGTFAGMVGIGFDAGITLGTGRAADVVGPNDNGGTTTDFDRPGDTDLGSIVQVPTHDASVLTFDFVPTTNGVQFDYLFASEEYNEYVNLQYNDVFAFLVNGRNCALTPDGGVVSVNAINSGNPNPGQDATPHHPELFRSNTAVDAVAPIDAEPDGFTTVLRCAATVVPNSTNTMKLAIADGADGRYDSSVFIRAGSLHTNRGPVAGDVAAGALQGSPAAVTLTATDADGDPLTYTVHGAPAHGTLSGTAPALTYTPAAGYTGPDSFTYSANDGLAESDIATVALTVSPVGLANRPPVANDMLVSTPQGSPAAVTLTATDADGDPLTYTVHGAPAHGTLSGTAPALTYTPAAGYAGPDTLTFTASDGRLDSDLARAAITVTPLPATPPPVATPTVAVSPAVAGIGQVVAVDLGQFPANSDVQVVVAGSARVTVRTDGTGSATAAVVILRGDLLGAQQVTASAGPVQATCPLVLQPHDWEPPFPRR